MNALCSNCSPNAVDIAAKFSQSGISFVLMSWYAHIVMNKSAVARIIVSNIKLV